MVLFAGAQWQILKVNGVAVVVVVLVCLAGGFVSLYNDGISESLVESSARTIIIVIICLNQLVWHVHILNFWPS